MATDPTELTGKVIDGVIVFEDGKTLPDGTLVKIEPVADSEKINPGEDTPENIKRLREMLLSFAGTIDDPDLPKDYAENIDHYLYGTPKRT